MEHIRYNIIGALQKKSSHVRQLAKDIGINHMSIQRRIKKLEDENVVDYREEGKNKVYFIKDSLESKQQLLILEHIKLLQLIKTNPRLRNIVENLQMLNIDLVMIFGSYAKRTHTKTSDIDIYVQTQDKTIKERIQLLDSKLSVKFGEFDQKNLLIKEIIKHHVIVKGVEKYYELIHQEVGQGRKDKNNRFKQRNI